MRQSSIKNNYISSSMKDIFYIPVKSPSSARAKLINMNRTNSISNYNIKKDYTFDLEEGKEDCKVGRMKYYTPKEEIFFSNNTARKNCIGLKIKSRTAQNSNLVTINNSNENTNTFLSYKAATSEKIKPVKVNHKKNYTVDDKNKEMHLYNNNNMFLNFQNDTVNKRRKNAKAGCYYSFDVNDKNRRMNYEAMLSKINSIFLIDESEVKDITKERIIESSTKANKVDEYMKYFNDNNFERVSNSLKRIIKRKELYKKEMLLYKNLCEELIKTSDVSDLDELSSIVNDTLPLNKANNIKEIINEKYITASSTQKNNRKYQIKYK